MASYSVTDARKNLSKLINLALAGEEVKITRRGQVIGRIVPKIAEPVRFGPEWFLAHRVVPENQDPEFDAANLVRRMRDED